jgi:quercetin dioxygenase-like cupin family protein
MSEVESPAPDLVVDIAAIERELRGSPAYERDGHSARTLVRQDDLRLVLLVLKTGSIMKEHRVHETATVHAVSGHVQLRLPNQLVDLPAGRLLVLASDVAHNVEAIEDSTLLLTLGQRAKS